MRDLPTVIPDNPNWHRLKTACVYYRERWGVEDEPGDDGCLLLYQAICLQNTPPVSLEEEHKCLRARAACWRLRARTKREHPSPRVAPGLAQSG